MDLHLTDKIAVVTGASKGIGLSITKAFVAEGALVVAGARSTGALEGLDRVTPVALDLGAPEGPARLVERALAAHGRVDVLVNNVGGVRLRLEGFLGTSDAEFEWAMQMNFFAALRATRAALPPMLKQGKGAIVNIATARKNAIASIGGLATGRFTTPRRGRDPGRLARLGAHGQRHRLELRHRRGLIKTT
jgi:NAD(P)-dependent dehydrogenase (short-subunit alcohol dehydrogenase family)